MNLRGDHSFVLTKKPALLMTDMICKFFPPERPVLDFFMGWCSTAKAFFLALKHLKLFGRKAEVFYFSESILSISEGFAPHILNNDSEINESEKIK